MPLPELISGLQAPPELLRRMSAIPGLWLVGGYLRKLYLEQVPGDIDLVCEGPLEAALDALARLTGQQPFALSERFRSHRLLVDGLSIDLSPMSEGGIEADLVRRDYTINALAVPLERLGPALVPADIARCPGAFEDLVMARLRMVSAANLRDDPLRIIRGLRLMALEGFIPEPATQLAWAELAGMVPRSAPERLHEELLLWLGAETRLVETLQLAAQTGVLWQLFPELRQAPGCEQNGYHHTNVWEHTLEALRQFETLLTTPPEPLKSWWPQIEASLAAPVSGLASARTLCRLALLLHDVSKPATRQQQEDGHISFHQHQELGALLAADYLQHLKFSNAESELVQLLIREHLRLGFYSEQLPLPPRLVYRFIRRLGAATPLLLLHSLADCLATRGPLNAQAWPAHVQAAAEILSHYYAADRVAAPPALLNGRQIMRLLGIAPGEDVGRVKAQLLEATAAGEVRDRGEAERFVLRLGSSAGAHENSGRQAAPAEDQQ